MSRIRDIHLKEEGYRRIHWAERHTPILNRLTSRFEREQPFAGMNMAISLHLEAKSACLVRCLMRGGAQAYVTGSNPYSTNDAVCAALADEGAEVFAIHGATMGETHEFWQEVLKVKPDLVIDDGADLINLLLGEHQADAIHLIGACEETTSGVQRLHAWEREGRLTFPTIAINDARSKSWFDNFYGTGQSVWDAVMRTTNMLVPGMTVVIAGYGWCGRGIAKIASGMGARVIITEIDPLQGMLAVLDGYEVKPMLDASGQGDLFITATSSVDVLTTPHFERMKNDALLCNAGHFNAEIDVPALEALAVQKEESRTNIDSYTMKDGRAIHLISKASLVNIAAGDGHPIEIMDMSFGLQALSAEYLSKNRELEPGVHAVPREIDEHIARLKLQTFGGILDEETKAQKQYRATDRLNPSQGGRT